LGIGISNNPDKTDV
ncbi:TPA: hypothetical protein ACWCIQ_005016, partial [Escherichia coli]